MKTIPMTARRAFRYAGRALQAGDPFEARTPADALILTSNGNAKRGRAAPAAPVARENSPAPTTKAGYLTRVMTAEPPPEPQREPPLITRSTDQPPADELDGLDAEALRELAERRGVAVHHRAGAEKLRAALREATQSQGSTEE